MLIKKLKPFYIAIFAISIFSCQTKKIETELSVVSDFSKEDQIWDVGFSDYPQGEEKFYELKSGWELLPSELKLDKKALKISGNNHSDDLFMYLKKSIKNLEGNSTYSINFEIEFATKEAKESFGIGGSPATSVYVGIGATSIEPKNILDPTDKHYRLNIKKMNQSQDGTDMKVIGNISNETEEFKYKLVKRTGTVTAKTDNNGQLWLIVGTDSGFEGTTTLYYSKIKTDLKKQN